MKKAVILLILIRVLSFHSAIGQTSNDPLKTLLDKIANVHDQFPQEKVHLHFDKPYYTIGDTIWFKAYVVNADRNHLSALSKILYVDLISERDSVKSTLRLPVNLGLAQGDFTLSANLTEGNYRIRAYTNWMRNFGEDYFFDKTISIGNALSNSIVTNANYTFSKDGDKDKVEANINYTGLDGIPLVANDLSYEVQLDNRNIAKGKSTTDDKGNVRITFSNDKSLSFKSGKITTILKIDDKKVIIKTIPVKSTSGAIDVQFFPESGQLVNNILSKVALKAVGADGLGVDVSGYITDKDNSKIAEFKTEHAGMGAFVLMPLAGNLYKAVVQFADGSEKSFDLPKASSKGYSLAIDNSGKDSIKIRISVSPQILQQGAEVTLLARTNNVINYVSKTKLQAFVLNATLPKKRFPTGIVQFTLFSGDYQPVAERLAFIKHPDELKIDLSTSKPSYTLREKVSMTMAITDPGGVPVTGSFSLSVTDMSKVPADENNETTIFSNLLLSSDLKGYIEKPNYYFTDVNEDKTRQLDNLLLTQGWRRLSPQAGAPALQFQPEQGIAISGKVLSGGRPLSKSKVTLFAASTGLLLDTLTDKEGKFIFDNLEFTDSTKFVIQARNAKDRSNVLVELDGIPSQLITKNKNSGDIQINVSSAILPYLQNSRKAFDELEKYGLLKSSVVLGEVTISAKKYGFGGVEIVENSSNMNLAGHYDHLVKPEQLKSYALVSHALQGKFPGMEVKDGVAKSRRALDVKTNTTAPMLVILDGMIITPTGCPTEACQPLNIISPMNVASIEILKPGANTIIYGKDGINGVIIINSKTIEEQITIEREAPGIISVKPKGYHIGREFYSPVYNGPRANSPMADLRTTIYWNPDLVPDADGKVKIEFFTADSPGTYRAVIEGLDYTGKLGRKVYTYTVSK